MYGKSHNGDEGSMKSSIMLTGKGKEIMNLEGGKKSRKVSVEIIADGMSSAAFAAAVF